jgi:hypothetical protein
MMFCRRALSKDLARNEHAQNVEGLPAQDDNASKTARILVRIATKLTARVEIRSSLTSLVQEDGSVRADSNLVLNVAALMKLMLSRAFLKIGTYKQSMVCELLDKMSDKVNVVNC